MKETGMLTSCSDYHIFQKLKFKSRQECMDSYCEVVDAAFEAGVRPRCHLEDVTRADIDGFVLPFVERLMRMSEQVPEELRSRSACATRWASASAIRASSCRGAFPS